ncbi:MAG TPA: rod shape-determining protein MreC [Candidatus Saccharimonadia bacterium]
MNLTGTNRRIVTIIAVGGAVMVLGVLGRLGPLRWVYDATLAPLGRAVVGAGSTAGEALANLGRIKDLAADNARLEQENATLRQRLAADADTRRDNDLLRKQLGLEVAGAPKEVAAEVMSAQPDSYRQFVTINKGAQAGVAPGMAVVSQGQLIGVINDVQARSARITLVTDPTFKLTAKDQDTGATGLVGGQLGGGLLLDKIGQSDTVKPGDSVTTSGLGGVVPSGLYIGQIESVDTRANVVFQSARVATDVRVSELRFVFVVTGQ